MTGTLAALAWFTLHVGYVLFVGMSVFWTVVWPDGNRVVRLRVIALSGIALIAIATIVEEATNERALGPITLVRLAIVAVAGFYGPEFLSAPVRGVRRLMVVGLCGLITLSVIIDPASPVTPALGRLGIGLHGLLLVALSGWLAGIVATAAVVALPRSSVVSDRLWRRYPRFADVAAPLVAVTVLAQYLATPGPTRSSALLIFALAAVAVTWSVSRLFVASGRRSVFRHQFLRGEQVSRRRGRPAFLVVAVGLQLVLSLVLVGATTQVAAARPSSSALSATTAGTTLTTVGAGVPWRSETTASTAPSVAAEGYSDRRTRAVPTSITLPGTRAATIVPVSTRGRELVIPAHGDVVGWWDGSSYLGDPYGAIVLAGHVDTIEDGLGFFFTLWNIREGQRVTLAADGHRQAYVVESLRQVPRTDLIKQDEAFAIDGPPRLVLITCAGTYRPDHGYSQNLIVVARPVG